jgi:hypothetical protein
MKNRLHQIGITGAFLLLLFAFQDGFGYNIGQNTLICLQERQQQEREKCGYRRKK